MAQYAIINVETIHKRIDELENFYMTAKKSRNAYGCY